MIINKRSFQKHTLGFFELPFTRYIPELSEGINTPELEIVQPIIHSEIENQIKSMLATGNELYISCSGNTQIGESLKLGAISSYLRKHLDGTTAMPTSCHKLTTLWKNEVAVDFDELAREMDNRRRKQVIGQKWQSEIPMWWGDLTIKLQSIDL